MSSSPSNSPDSTNASEASSSRPRANKPASEKITTTEQSIDSEAVKTFAFEVSAGRTALPQDAELPIPVVPKPKFIAHGTTPIPQQPTNKARLIEPDEQQTPKSKEVPIVSGEANNLELPDVETRVIKPQSSLATLNVTPRGYAQQRSSWWIASLGVHVLILVLLGFSTLAVMKEEEQLDLYASPVVHETIEEFDDLEIESTDELESLDDEFTEELSEPESATLADLTSDSLLEESPLSESLQSESSLSDAVGDFSEIGQLFGDTGTGMSDLGAGTGGSDGSMARFFGTEVKARRILYMLDNSGGMRKGGKFEALVSELQASVNALQPKQKFYVVFYSDTVYPLFFPQSVRKFVTPNDRNRRTLERWLDSVELCGGNAIDEALAAAEVIRPDAVFLLTDGDLFTTEKKKALLLDSTDRSYSIHTFGLGVGENTKTAAGLKQVAEANGGIFRTVKVSDEMKELAKEKERPYHNKEPGPVWGLKVGARRF